MASFDVFASLSPLDHRYRISNPRLFDQLSKYLSEAALLRYEVVVEIALLRAHAARKGLLTPDNEAAINTLVDTVSGEAVYREEERTRHNIRALVNVIKEHLPAELRPLVHLGATSMDILDTANALRYRAAVEDLVLPVLRRTIEVLVRRARAYAQSPQVGRTHGQHAVPITFGFFLAEYVRRLSGAFEAIATRAGGLAGKLAGAVGAHNAMSLLVDDPRGLEKEVLGTLGISVSAYSNQIVEPEYLLRLLLEINAAFGILANLADDLRHLQRTEIDEVREYFAPSQVGSSTMPQKRNPWNCEHIKSLWKAFSPRVVTFFSDQLSEHQRDLSNSASSRFVPEYVAAFVLAASRAESVLEGLEVREERMLENLRNAGDMVVAEALYIMLGKVGKSDAHEALRRLTQQAISDGSSLAELIEDAPEVASVLQQEAKRLFGCSLDTLLREPERYRGTATEKTLDTCACSEKMLRDYLQSELSKDTKGDQTPHA